MQALNAQDALWRESNFPSQAGMERSVRQAGLRGQLLDAIAAVERQAHRAILPGPYPRQKGSHGFESLAARPELAQLLHQQSTLHAERHFDGYRLIREIR